MSAGKVIGGLTLGLLVLAGCGGGDEGGNCDPIAATLVARINVAPATATMADGESLQLAATAFSCDGTQLTVPSFTWQSSDATTVSVSPTGMALGVKIGGPVAVKASTQGKEGVASISVAARAVASVRIEPATASVAVGRTSTLAAKAFDAQGRELPDRPATWSSDNEAVVTVSQLGAITGVAVGGPATVTATIEGHSGTAQVTVVNVAVASVTVSPPSATITAGATVQLSAVLKDDQGNVLTGRAVDWSTSDALRASVSNTGLVTGLLPGGPVAIFATSEGRSGSSQVTVSPAPPTRVAFLVQPSNVVAGASISPPVQVEIQNALGARVTNSSASVTLALAANPGSATLGGTLTVAAVNGVATFVDLNLNHAAQGYTLGATSAGLDGATSSAFNVTAGAPAALGFLVQPSTVVAGAVITPAIQVQVRDALGNPVLTATSLVMLSLDNNPGGATLGGTVTVGATNGVSTFDGITLDRTGSGYTLTANSPGLAGATSAAFDVTPGAAARVGFAVQPTDIHEGTPFNPEVVVEVLDALGNRVTSFVWNVALQLRSATDDGPGKDVALEGGGSRAFVSGAAAFPGLTVNFTGIILTSRTLTLRTNSSFARVLSQTFEVNAF